MIDVDVDLEGAKLAAHQETQQGLAVRQSAQQISVSTEQEYQVAAQVLLQVKEKIKALDEKRKGFTGPLNKVVKEINAFFKQPLDAYRAVEQDLKAAMSAFQTLAAQERQRALQEAAQAAQTHQPQSFTALMQQAAQHAAPQAAGTHTREVWRFSIDDPSALPREFLMPDERLIGEHVRKLKGDARIPGVRVWSETTVVARGA